MNQNPQLETGPAAPVAQSSDSSMARSSRSCAVSSAVCTLAMGLMRFWLCGVATICACALPRAPAFPMPLTAASLSLEIDHWTYVAVLGPGGRTMSVEALFPRAPTGDLEVAPGALAYVSDLEIESRGIWQRTAPAHAEVFDVPACAREACHIRYTFDIARAARDLDDQDLATEFDGAYEAPPSTWLLHPALFAHETRIRFRVVAREGAAFAIGVPSNYDGASITCEQSARELLNGPYAVMGNWRLRNVAVLGGSLDVAISNTTRAMSDVELTTWVHDAATNLARYYGSFPAKRVLVVVAPDDGTRIFGMTMGGGGAAILMRLGREVTAANAREDWVLTHELIHTCFPSLGAPHRWMEEGLATYLEPVVRVRSAVIDAKTFWRDLVQGLPQGLPRSGDRGLEATPTWGRTYWGGALFWLLADIGIREATGNTRSLDDSLRAIAENGGSVVTPWPIERILEVADAASGQPILKNLYERLALAPGSTDLEGLWRRLGIRASRGKVAFQNDASMSAVRDAITRSIPHSN
jgi:hypothetical protein